jgi:hypothetical protein
MARTISRLSARTVATLKTAGMHADGGGLYLKVKPTGAKAWVFVFQWHGARKEMGLGSVSSAKTLWDMPVSDITVDDVVAVLKPIWSVKDETASRARPDRARARCGEGARHDCRSLGQSCAVEAQSVGAPAGAQGEGAARTSRRPALR